MRTVSGRRELDPHNRIVLLSVEALFKRLVRLLVERGISTREAESLLRTVWVHQVANSAGVGRKGLNVSWIALMTGLDRKEVSRILKSDPRVDPALVTRSHPANRVLAGWYSDQTFAKNDVPSALPVKSAGRRRPSFWTLADRYCPGVYPGLILRELCRVGAVEKLKDGRVRARMRRYRTKKISNETASQTDPGRWDFGTTTSVRRRRQKQGRRP